MNDKIKKEISDSIDSEGLWYWIWQGYYRRYAVYFSIDLLKKITQLSKDMSDLQEELQDGGYLL